jgi:ATP-dependent DNA helicase PIF1
MSVNKKFQDPEKPQGWSVVVLAPTGLAAYMVNGQTLNRFLKLPVFGNSDEDKHWPLSDQNLRDMRALIPNLKLIIIDEISMVSNVRLAQLHLRLLEVFKESPDDYRVFANVNIIVLGDFLQVEIFLLCLYFS